ncbi:conserved hypothetical protein [Taylorella asinigenitalis 14/45]|uniref:Cytotoxic translational repressor of toxin-antitoxin stability system n=2 Tax=Taylorella asinigenitalis TaxID=84590 RepID=G4QDD2_TAYAM|nr:hypothetical protein [Taylorella asinigenitalis]AEP35949.1 Cytotoxic translational repressor of toxin-antitoxin stability system [Taylorella asinigenitalis MCE3]CCG19521.1 conserved hypothetical protein [Taylorella asinigenitalis 14/45]
MYTIYETDIFISKVDKLLSTEERLKLCSYLSLNPYIGDVIPASGGCRKFRWEINNTGKRAGLRVIYKINLMHGEIYLLYIYRKSEISNLKSKFIEGLVRRNNESQ